MTDTLVPDIIPFAQYEAAAAATTFDYGWWIREATDLQVFVDGDLVATDDYSVTGVQSSTGGQVIFGTALAGGEIVTISTLFPFGRLTAFQTSGSLRAAALNLELSYLAACVLQLQRDLNRTMKLSPSSQANPDLMVWPEPEDGRIPYWNGAEGVMSNSAFSIDVLQGNAADIVANLTAINALYTQLANIVNVSQNLGTGLPVTVTAQNIISIIAAASAIANIAVVAGSINGVNAVAADLPTILDAPTNAATAVAAKNDAVSAQLASEAAAAAAMSSLSDLDTRYWGALAVAPTGPDVDAGDLYFDTTVPGMLVYDGANWVAAYVPGTDVLNKNNNLSELTSVPTARGNLGLEDTSTDNALVRFDGTTGATQNSGVVVSDTNEISGYAANINLQTGTTYTLQASDMGKVVVFNNGSAITLTLPNSLQAGFNCTVIQDGAGQVTCSAGSGATLHNRLSHTKTAGQRAAVGLIVKSNAGSAAIYNLSGDTTA